MSSMAVLHNEILQILILKLKREYSARFDYSQETLVTWLSAFGELKGNKIVYSGVILFLTCN